MIPKGTRGQGFEDSSKKQKKHSKKVTYILLAKNLSFIDKRELGTLNNNIAEIERMLKALIKSL